MNEDLIQHVLKIVTNQTYDEIPKYTQQYHANSQTNNGQENPKTGKK